jgi:ABC-2 type transport system permease protein
MKTILGNEILKTSLKWRSYISFITIAAIIPLLDLGLYLEQGGWARSITRGLSQDFLVMGNIKNGYFITYFIMNALWIHIPFLITLGAGDQLAGEATGGTFRILLTRPASRSRILFTKYLTALLYTTALVVFMGALSLGLGTLVFGTGDLLVPGAKMLIIHAEDDVLWRMGLAFALATWGMWTVASLAFLFSSLVENGIGPIIGTMAVIIVSYIIGNVPVDLFASIKPYLFTSYLDLWSKVFEDPVPWDAVVRSVLVLGAFNIGFYAVTWYIFLRKDVLS